MSKKLAAATALLKTAARNRNSLRPLSSKSGGPKFDEDEKPATIQRLPLEQSEAVPAMMVDPFYPNVEQLSLLRKFELRNKSQNLFGFRDEMDDVGRGIRTVIELRPDVSDIGAQQSEFSKQWSELKGSLSIVEKKLKQTKAQVPFVFASGVASGVGISVIGMCLWKWAGFDN